MNRFQACFEICYWCSGGSVKYTNDELGWLRGAHDKLAGIFINCFRVSDMEVTMSVQEGTPSNPSAPITTMDVVVFKADLGVFNIGLQPSFGDSYER